MAKKNATGIGTRIEQKQMAISIPNVELAPYLEKTSKELEEEVQNEVSENPLLEIKESDTQPVKAADANAMAHMRDYDRIPFSKNRGADSDYFVPDAVAEETLEEHLMNQINERDLSEVDQVIAEYIVGNLDTNGWLVRSSAGIADDLTFNADLEVEREDVERVLKMVQALDPPGIGGRTLKECLLIQVHQKPRTPENEQLAMLISDYLEDLALAHFDKICTKMNITTEQLRLLKEDLHRLNPKPGSGYSSSANEVRRNQIIPEFEITVEEGEIYVSMPNSIPELVLNEKMSEKIETGKEKDKSMKNFYDKANRFISILRRRQEKLMLVMQSIIKHQKEFFLTGDEDVLVPLKYDDIKKDTGLDQTSISRICGGDRGKYVNTPWGTYKLKNFFSTAIASGANGEEAVSNKAVKNAVKDIVEHEPKNNPLSDTAIQQLLKERGYEVARRTVAKYRIMLGIPDSRRRKEL